MSERERIAAELHEQYLATARRLNWPLRTDVDRPYEQLSDAAKELDRVFADWHLAELERHQAESAKAIRWLDAALREATCDCDYDDREDPETHVTFCAYRALRENEHAAAIQRAREGT